MDFRGNVNYSTLFEEAMAGKQTLLEQFCSTLDDQGHYPVGYVDPLFADLRNCHNRMEIEVPAPEIICIDSDSEDDVMLVEETKKKRENNSLLYRGIVDCFLTVSFTSQLIL